MTSLWRVGRRYGIHVYEVSPTSPERDRPVATFFRAEDAESAVEAHNALAGQQEAGVSGCDRPPSGRSVG